MSSQKVSPLGYALLGLLQQKPASGYDLRKIFASTSMKTYSDSPGAIYPALRRLERDGMIRGTVEGGSELRPRQVFRVTPKGLAELKRWIALPIGREGLTSGLKMAMLRFAFSERAIGASTSLEILKSMEAALGPHLRDLGEKLEQMRPFAPTSGRLALECGIRSYESLLQWARYAISIYEKQLKGGVS